MKIKRLLCIFLSAVFTLTAIVSCRGTTDTETGTAPEEATTDPEDTSAPAT